MTTRRRFLTIGAAAAMFPLTGRAAEIYTWQGIALGSRATLRLAHPDAKAICHRVAAEISRLEGIFSLYRPDSALSRLNRIGILQAPPFELLECLSLARRVHSASAGRFDPTIQPLWTCYAESYAAGAKPSADQLDKARSLVGFEKVAFNASEISIREGMALTLNGIAQGFIADRIAQLLTDEGLTNIFIDTGELRALGGRPDGTAWPVKLAAGGTIHLQTRALATSAPLGTAFDAEQRMGHILDPRNGLPVSGKWKALSVSAPSAAVADALSTAAISFNSSIQIVEFITSFPNSYLEAAVRSRPV